MYYVPLLSDQFALTTVLLATLRTTCYLLSPCYYQYESYPGIRIPSSIPGSAAIMLIALQLLLLLPGI